MSTPLLSVCLITYNHRKFIREAIEGVLMQEVTFPWELIIADDFSTDGTREIILEYKQKFPDLIKLVLQDRNVGAYKNWMDLLTAAKHKYIAYFEGDDYWLDPNKLQKQVDFLEANPEYVISYHDAKVIDTNGNVMQQTISRKEFKRDNTSEELIKFKFHIPTVGILFRNVILEYPPEFAKVANGDTFLISLLGKYGGSKYQSDIQPAMYRHHGGGVWSLTSELQKTKNHITTAKWMAAYYNRIGESEYAEYYMQFLDKVISNFADSTTRTDKYYQLGWKLGAPYRFIRKLFT
jgi:glycosyltransferase involved in cell wall biosynthesis